jgi:hypothetical protein
MTDRALIERWGLLVYRDISHAKEFRVTSQAEAAQFESNSYFVCWLTNWQKVNQ